MSKGDKTLVELVVEELSRKGLTMKAKTKAKTKPTPTLASDVRREPLAVSIKEAAAIVSLSRASFYRLYIDTKRVNVRKRGGRLSYIDFEELRAAYQEETRGAPKSN